MRSDACFSAARCELTELSRSVRSETRRSDPSKTSSIRSFACSRSCASVCTSRACAAFAASRTSFSPTTCSSVFFSFSSSCMTSPLSRELSLSIFARVFTSSSCARSRSRCAASRRVFSSLIIPSAFSHCWRIATTCLRFISFASACVSWRCFCSLCVVSRSRAYRLSAATVVNGDAGSPSGTPSRQTAAVARLVVPSGEAAFAVDQLATRRLADASNLPVLAVQHRTTLPRQGEGEEERGVVHLGKADELFDAQRNPVVCRVQSCADHHAHQCECVGVHQHGLAAQVHECNHAGQLRWKSEPLPVALHFGKQGACHVGGHLLRAQRLASHASQALHGFDMRQERLAHAGLFEDALVGALRIDAVEQRHVFVGEFEERLQYLPVGLHR